MKLALIGADYKTANIELREKISLTESKIKLMLTQIKEIPYMEGAVLISTCNRTEIYLSYNQELSDEELSSLYCDAVGLSKEFINNTIGNASQYLYIKKDEAVITYLFELASGIHSMIFGDDQITVQVGDAINLANEIKVSDSILNTLFRHAITCGKKVKANVTLKEVSPSVASQAVDVVRDYIKQKEICKVLVIGNGEVGRNVSKLLVGAGCEVYITLRTYKYKQNLVPKGCRVTEYDKRGDLYSEVDILISATKSPHHTVSYEAICQCAKKPSYILDLALPRDIDPKIGELSEVTYYDIDTLGQDARYDNTEEIAVIEEIIKEQQEKFIEWFTYRKKNLRRNRENDIYRRTRTG